MTHVQVTPEQAQEALEWWGRGVFDHGAAEQALRNIASMHYEYAVQNAETGTWLREESDGVVVHTSDPLAADWGTDLEEAESYAVWITGEKLTEYRVMRRLVSDPEVVE